jgi:hypothetical protein
MRRLFVAAALVGAPVLAGCGGLHGDPAGKAVLPSLVATPTGSPSAGPSHSPAPSALPATPGPSGDNFIVFSGGLTGTLLHPRVTCQQNIPQGGQGYMNISGVLDGHTRMVSIWSKDAHTVQDIYEGVAAGQMDYLESSAGGITGFDWSRGAILHATLPAAKSGGGSLTVTGRIVCP